MEPHWLVADVGGTNTRVGLAGPDGVQATTVRRYRNENYDSFTAVAQDYLRDHDVPSAMAVAIAGPVTSHTAHLTNRDWDFDTQHLGRDLTVSNVFLLNDLAALGHALPILPFSAMTSLTDDARADGQQALIVGLGTGFNVSLVHLRTEEVFEAELGHASLPYSVVRVLTPHVADVDVFQTVEHLFSGQGLRRLDESLGGGGRKPEEIVLRADPVSAKTMDLMASALAVFVREIVYQYMPRAGLYFNGSLARTMLGPDYRETVLSVLRADTRFAGRFASVPVFTLTEDAAALHGCARYLAHQVPAR
ncbi:MAG: glucokinase [Pseudomonadota bacterium]